MIETHTYVPAGGFRADVGVGEHFDMPEFHWPRGYLFAWLLMGSLLVGTLVFFRRRGLL